LLATLKAEQSELAAQYGKYVPVALKIAPDLEPEQVNEIAGLLIEHGFDGVIATNTTLARDAVVGMDNAEETGGLSGAPVRNQSTEVIRQLAEALQGKIPIIGVGGILSG
jgi:dihydroorotate dehydrogenase